MPARRWRIHCGGWSGGGLAPLPLRLPPSRSDTIAAMSQRLFALRGATSVRAQRRPGDPGRDHRADERDHGAQLAHARPRRQLHIHRHERSQRRVPRRRRAGARVRARAAAVRAGDPGAALDAPRDQGPDPLPRRRAPRVPARLPRRGRRSCAPTCSRRSRRDRSPAAPRSMRSRRPTPACRRGLGEIALRRVGRGRRSVTIEPHAPGVRRAHPPHPRLPGRGRLRRAGAARAVGQQRVALFAPACGARGDRPRAVRSEPLSRPVQLDPARAARRPLRSAGVVHRDRQRLVRHPARGRRGAARARLRARARVAVVLGLPPPLARPRERARSLSRWTAPSATTSRGYCRRSRSPPALRSCATRTTRPPPRWRRPTSPRSSPRSRRTYA